MAALILQVTFSFYAKKSKNSFFFCKYLKKFIVSEEYCIAHPYAELVFLPECRYHNSLLGNVVDLLQQTDSLSLLYQHVDCLYALFKYRFSGYIDVKVGQVFDNVQGAVFFIQRNRMSSIAKTKPMGKKHRKQFLSSFQKTK